MRTDFERLNWLAKNGQSVRSWDDGKLTLVRWHARVNQRPERLRALIDAAMAVESSSAPEAEQKIGGFLRASL